VNHEERGGHSNLPGCLNQEDGGIVCRVFASIESLFNNLYSAGHHNAGFLSRISRDFKQALELEIAANIGMFENCGRSVRAMAIKDAFKITRKTFFNPRGWLGY